MTRGSLLMGHYPRVTAGNLPVGHIVNNKPAHYLPFSRWPLQMAPRVRGVEGGIYTEVRCADVSIRLRSCLEISHHFL